jgi:orotate phosphoribosyltransferase
VPVVVQRRLRKRRLAKTVAERLSLPLAYVRREAREVGGPLVERAPGAGARAVLIEDVVADGGSAAKALRAPRAETSLRGDGRPVDRELELPADAGNCWRP